jgi:hypothetical protein
MAAVSSFRNGYAVNSSVESDLLTIVEAKTTQESWEEREWTCDAHRAGIKIYDSAHIGDVFFSVDFRDGMNLHVIQTCFEKLDHFRAAGIRDGQTRSRAQDSSATLEPDDALPVRHSGNEAATQGKPPCSILPGLLSDTPLHSQTLYR